MNAKLVQSTFDMTEIEQTEDPSIGVDNFNYLYFVTYEEKDNDLNFIGKKIVDNNLNKKYGLISRIDSVTQDDMDKNNPLLEEQLKYHIDIVEHIYAKKKDHLVTVIKTVDEKTDDELIQLIKELKLDPKLYKENTLGVLPV